ncbi:MAG: MBL fold metallo-hydrolase [Nitrospinota bacterium]|nr:MAG: MBL fold metallo-hydrolase [Nitrospinota bacterium]
MQKLVILGSAQDGGVPHIGCACSHCQQARHDPAAVRMAPSLGIIDLEADKAFVIDASPHLPDQLYRLRSRRGREESPFLPDAIFLTHAHIGHYLGLAYLGKEGWNTQALPLYCTAEMESFLRHNKPFRYLLEQGNVCCHRLLPHQRHPLTPALSLLPVEVPHRNEDANTLAYVIQGRTLSVLYMPDLDYYTEAVLALIREVDIAIIDGTFFSGSELPAMRMAGVPHPPVVESLARLEGIQTRIIFTHLNHTNPLLDPAHPAWQRVSAAGFAVAKEGEEIEI